MILRPARECDVPALIGLARRAWLGGFADAPPAFVREWLAREFEQEWYPRYWPSMTVAVADGILLGLVQPMKDEVNGLWVDPAAQGRGVGTALLRHGEAEIAAAGYDRAWLSCSGFNPNGLRFYEARDYRRCGGETKERANGVVEEMVIFERHLATMPDLAGE
jgi:[ribosomal protein S18]-alanine N-acetyltransferase